MNLSSFAGLIIAASVIWTGVIGPSARPEIFLDCRAVLLVVGGTLAAGLIAFPAARLFGLFRLFFSGLLFKRTPHHQQLICEILVAASMHRENLRHLRQRRPKHPFLAEGYQLISEGILNPKQLREVLEKRSEYFKRSYTSDAKMLTSLAKFPPAFGLLGASTGMIAMMTELGRSNPDQIGPAMAVALVATFWGIAMANFILLPLADYAMKAANDDSHTRQLIIDGLIMILNRRDSASIVAHLNGFLPLGKRLRVETSNSELRIRNAA